MSRLRLSPHSLLLDLLIVLFTLAPLPSFFGLSPFAGKFPTQSLYIPFAILREIVVMLISANVLVIFVQGFNSKMRFANYALFVLAGLVLATSYLFNRENITTYLFGLRYLFLALIPVAILIKPPIMEARHFNGFYIGVAFFIFISILAFLYAFNGYPPYFGTTFLGPRFGFAYENPITASMGFGACVLFISLMLGKLLQKSLKIKLLITQIFLTILTLYTGGRAGLLVVLISWFFMALRLIPVNVNVSTIYSKAFTISISAFVIIIFLYFLSQEYISGRGDTAEQLNKGLVEGLYGSRLRIFTDQILSLDPLDLIVGRSGIGTNSAKTFVDSVSLISDSYLTASLSSFGLFGLLIFMYTFFIMISKSYSLAVPLSFMVMSLSQNTPELLLPWSVLCLSFAATMTKHFSDRWSQ